MTDNFSFDTIKNFDEHIASSIPRYQDIHLVIDSILEYFIKNYINIYDIGCSTGSLLKRIDNKYRNKNISLTGYDICKNLIPDNSGRCVFIKDDILKGHVYFKDADIIFSIFTICFINLKHRQALINKIYNNLNKGGIFIFVDKIYCNSTKIQEIFTFLYYDFKRNKFKCDEILNKEQALREIQQPLTDVENINMLNASGFRNIETFWRYYNFKGYLCIK
jgi:tRNA (cmo5U34)-methyltransferase